MFLHPHLIKLGILTRAAFYLKPTYLNLFAIKHKNIEIRTEGKATTPNPTLASSNKAAQPKWKEKNAVKAQRRSQE